MATSEAQKNSNRKWDSEHMITMSCRLRKEIADEFRQVCSARGTTPAAAIKQFVLEYIGKAE